MIDFQDDVNRSQIQTFPSCRGNKNVIGHQANTGRDLRDIPTSDNEI